MNPSINDWSAIYTGLTALATLFLVFVTYGLFRVTKQLKDVSNQMKEAQAIGQLIQTINASNQMILGDERNLRAANELYPHEGLDDSDEAARKRWIAFVTLNQYELLYFLHKRDVLGEFSKGFLQASVEQVLDRILSHSFVLKLVETRGYHPEFVEFCRERVAIIELQRDKKPVK